MRFVKATTRLPELDKPVCLTWKGEPCSGIFQKHYDKIECYIHNRGTYLEASFVFIEWLDMDEQDEGWVPEIRQRIGEQLTELKKGGEHITNIKAFAYLRIYYKKGVYDGAINLVEPVVIYPAPPATT